VRSQTLLVESESDRATSRS